MYAHFFMQFGGELQKFPVPLLHRIPYKSVGITPDNA